MWAHRREPPPPLSPLSDPPLPSHTSQTPLPSPSSACSTSHSASTSLSTRSSRSAAARDPEALRDALRRMERTMVAHKAHPSAQEARRWGYHVPALLQDVESKEVGDVVDRLVRFRDLHARRSGLRRKIEAQLRPAPMPRAGRPHSRFAAQHCSQQKSGTCPPSSRSDNGSRPQGGVDLEESLACELAGVELESSTSSGVRWASRPQLA